MNNLSQLGLVVLCLVTSLSVKSESRNSKNDTMSGKGSRYVFKETMEKASIHLASHWSDEHSKKVSTYLKESILPVLEFDDEVVKEAYYDSIAAAFPAVEQTEDSTIVSVSCIFTFPDDYDEFPTPEVTDPDGGEVSLTFQDSVDYANYAVSRTWLAIGATGDTTKHAYIIQWDKTSYTVEIDELTIDDSILDTASICVGKEYLLEVETTYSCADSLVIEWYLDGDDTADAEGNQIYYTWEEEFTGDIVVNVSGKNFVSYTERAAYVETISPPAFEFNIDSINFYYTDEGELPTILPTDSSTTVEVSCSFDFPNDFMKFPEPIISGEYSSITDTIAPIINYDSLSVTKIWEVIDKCGKISKYYLTIQGAGDPEPVTIEFNRDDIMSWYAHSDDAIDVQIDTTKTSTSVGITCVWAFPSFYNYFPEPIISGEYSSINDTIAPIINYDSLSVTKIWEVIDKCGNIYRHEFILYRDVVYSIDLNQIYMEEYDQRNEGVIGEYGTAYICPGKEVAWGANFDNVCSDGGEEIISWYLDGDSIADEKGRDITYTWNEIGVYEIEVRVKGPVHGGSATLRATVIVDYDNKPEYTIEKTDAVCKNSNEGEIRVKVADNSNIDVLIDGNDTERVNNQVTELVSLGWHKVLIRPDDGCEIIDSVEVSYQNRADFTILDDEIDLLNNEELRIENTSPDINSKKTFTWDFGDDSPTINSNEKSITHTYEDPGTYTVTLTSKSDDCESTDSMKQTVRVIETDETPPTVALSFDGNSPTNEITIPINIQFSEAVEAFSLADISVEGGTLSNLTGSGDTYQTTLAPDKDGSVKVMIAANVVSDAAGNENKVSEVLEITYDGTRPTVDIESEQGSISNSSPIVLNIKFREPVNGFSLDDITVEGGSLSPLSLSGTVYRTLLTPSKEGTMKVQVNENKVSDEAGNGNEASNVLEIEYNTINPLVGIESSEGEFTNTNSITLNINFTEAVTDFTEDDITVEGGTLDNFTGEGSSYSIVLTPAAEGVIKVYVQENVVFDSDGNGNKKSEEILIEYDISAPTLVISSGQMRTNASSVPLVFTFNEPVTGFSVEDITVAGGAISELDSVGDEYTATLSLTTEGEVTLLVEEGLVSDKSGNTNAESGELVIVYDVTPPEIVIAPEEEHPVGSASFTATVTFSEYVSEFGQEDVNLSGGNLVSFDGAGTHYTLEIRPDNDSLVFITIDEQVAVDSAGNYNQATSRTIELNQVTAISTRPDEAFFYYVYENTLFLNNQPKKPLRALLLSASGKTVYSFPIRYPENEYRLMGYPSGFYFLEILTEDSILFKKVILE